MASKSTMSTQVQSTVSKDVLYLDVEKATALTSDMVTHLKGINQSLSTLNTLLTKAVNKKVATGTYATVFKDWAKKCKTQATYAQSKKTALKSKFEADTKDYTIKLLSDRLAELEAKVAAIKTS